MLLSSLTPPSSPSSWLLLCPQALDSVSPTAQAADRGCWSLADTFLWQLFLENPLISLSLAVSFPSNGPSFSDLHPASLERDTNPFKISFSRFALLSATGSSWLAMLFTHYELMCFLLRCPEINQILCWPSGRIQMCR